MASKQSHKRQPKNSNIEQKGSLKLIYDLWLLPSELVYSSHITEKWVAGALRHIYDSYMMIKRKIHKSYGEFT